MLDRFKSRLRPINDTLVNWKAIENIQTKDKEKKSMKNIEKSIRPDGTQWKEISVIGDTEQKNRAEAIFEKV